MIDQDEALKLPVNPDDTTGLRQWLELSPSHNGISTLRMRARQRDGAVVTTQTMTMHDRDWCHFQDHWAQTRWK